MFNRSRNFKHRELKEESRPEGNKNHRDILRGVCEEKEWNRKLENLGKICKEFEEGKKNLLEKIDEHSGKMEFEDSLNLRVTVGQIADRVMKISQGLENDKEEGRIEATSKQVEQFGVLLQDTKRELEEAIKINDKESKNEKIHDIKTDLRFKILIVDNTHKKVKNDSLKNFKKKVCGNTKVLENDKVKKDIQNFEDNIKRLSANIVFNRKIVEKYTQKEKYNEWKNKKGKIVEAIEKVKRVIEDQEKIFENHLKTKADFIASFLKNANEKLGEEMEKLIKLNGDLLEAEGLNVASFKELLKKNPQDISLRQKWPQSSEGSKDQDHPPVPQGYDASSASRSGQRGNERFQGGERPFRDKAKQPSSGQQADRGRPEIRKESSSSQQEGMPYRTMGQANERDQSDVRQSTERSAIGRSQTERSSGNRARVGCWSHLSSLLRDLGGGRKIWENLAKRGKINKYTRKLDIDIKSKEGIINGKQEISIKLEKIGLNKKRIFEKISSATTGKNQPNQDSCFISKYGGGVFDGVGGSYGGDTASKKAKDFFKQKLPDISKEISNLPEEQIKEKLKKMTLDIHNDIKKTLHVVQQPYR
jgi:hypothetical protein